MARQVRSEATRRKLIDAAIEVFSEVGYASAARAAIIERAGMTKGALYHHFESMDSLASAIIEEGSGVVLDTFRTMCDSSSPGLENMIHGMFAAAEVLASDRAARVAEQLMFALGEFNESASRVYANWLEAMATQAGRASAEGDLKEGLDPHAVSESVVGAMLGTRLLYRATSDGDLIGQLSRMWELLLPAVVADASLPYFREFLAREALRRNGASPSTE
ncbi:TetR/AcrR family transcriptional regulator [Mycobacterium branderi]|uniref:Spore coat protein CotS n=1 Tax=Mycobacterium branderi TaxID=43348 RepID=A0A7I7W664_9MYCO|nr:TetR/AcrR family transcriptional regulator [Mycobacterium branderi]MCV7235694.1 TetR/AcrR family transcriptional regulator [Mycobacterium branderi]ORA37871.1 spore coat protein CotS [Mycobacterium branderi]BBZ12427.1 TetR family transcriptional regulator [Mycobacterium branderi]